MIGGGDWGGRRTGRSQFSSDLVSLGQLLLPRLSAPETLGRFRWQLLLSSSCLLKFFWKRKILFWVWILLKDCHHDGQSVVCQSIYTTAQYLTDRRWDLTYISWFPCKSYTYFSVDIGRTRTFWDPPAQHLLEMTGSVYVSENSLSLKLRNVNIRILVNMTLVKMLCKVGERMSKKTIECAV